MAVRVITLAVTEDMFGIISDALLKNLLEAEKIVDHAGSSEFAVDRAASAAWMFHSFVSCFEE